MHLDHCNHLRTADLFAESINTKVGFRALRCDNYEDFQKGLCDGNESELMGYHTPSKYATVVLEIEFVYWRRLFFYHFSIRGIFQFKTNGESPFARGWNTESLIYSISYLKAKCVRYQKYLVCIGENSYPIEGSLWGGLKIRNGNTHW